MRKGWQRSREQEHPQLPSGILCGWALTGEQSAGCLQAQTALVPDIWMSGKKR